MGRVSVCLPVKGPKVQLGKMAINRGGYDCRGAYWGIGQPLYWAADETGQIDWYFRAANRDAAKAQVRERYPDARFYR